MRKLEQSLAHAESLRDFALTNREAFEKSHDWQDIVLLADEILKPCRVSEKVGSYSITNDFDAMYHDEADSS